MKKRIFTTVAIAAVAIASLNLTNLNAEPERPPLRPGEPGPFLERAIKHLELTPEQTEKIKAELRAEKENIKPLLEELHVTRKDLREVIQSGGDEKAIRTAHAKVAEVEADLAVQRAKIRAKIVPVLNDEQLRKLKEFEARVDEFAARAIQNFGKRLGD